MKKNILKLALILMLAFTGFASAKDASDVKFSKDLKGEERKTIIKQVEKYIGDIKTIKADFMQISSNGGYAEGKFYIKRPGKMRLEYYPPSPVLILSNGDDLVYYDKDLDQTSHIDVDDTPAAILLNEKIKLDDDDYKVTNVTKEPGAIEITIAQDGDEDEGALTLFFSTKPLKLKQWRVRDAQDILTTISLYNQKYGSDLENSLFKLNKKRKDPLKKDKRR